LKQSQIESRQKITGFFQKKRKKKAKAAKIVTQQAHLTLQKQKYSFSQVLWRSHFYLRLQVTSQKSAKETEIENAREEEVEINKCFRNLKSLLI
jgi:hypothetical protein